jgi:hypothetical protein
VAAVPRLTGVAPATGPVLDVATISKADEWVERMLPRFVAHVRAACSGAVRLHLVLLVDAEAADADATAAARARGLTLFDHVVERPFADPFPGERLLVFDAARAGLAVSLELPELLYLDPDTDVVDDLQGIERSAALAPADPAVWLNLTATYVNEGEPAAGEAVARAGLRHCPESPDVRWNLGLLLLEQGRWREGSPNGRIPWYPRTHERFVRKPEETGWGEVIERLTAAASLRCLSRTI